MDWEFVVNRPVIFGYEFDDLVGAADIQPDGSVVIRLTDPRICAAFVAAKQDDISTLTIHHSPVKPATDDIYLVVTRQEFGVITSTLKRNRENLQRHLDNPHSRLLVTPRQRDEAEQKVKKLYNLTDELLRQKAQARYSHNEENTGTLSNM